MLDLRSLSFSWFSPRLLDTGRLYLLYYSRELVPQGFYLAPLGSTAITMALSGPYQAPPTEELVIKPGAQAGEQAAWQTMVSAMASAIESGTTTARSNMHALGRMIASGEDTKAEDVQSYFDGLSYKGKPGEVRAVGKSSSMFRAQSKLGSEASVRLPEVVTAVETKPDDGEVEKEKSSKGVPMVDYRNYPLKGYVNLPSPIISLLQATKMDYYLIIGRPSAAASAGLVGYKEVTTKKERSDAPFIVVIDKPGMLEEFEDSKYIWVEFALSDVFMLVRARAGIDW